MNSSHQMQIPCKRLDSVTASSGFYEEAIILLNKAIKGEKGELNLYVNRGDCFFKENNLEFAMADYSQALELDPTSATARKRKAIVFNEYGVQEYLAKRNKVRERGSMYM